MKTGLFALAFTLTVVLQATAAEQRCDALGSACICSEPLSATGQDFANTGGHNPPDSTSKECNGGSAFSTAIGARSVTPINLPPGATATSVYEVKGNSGATILNGNDLNSPGVARACWRAYQFMSANHPITCAPQTNCACRRIKIMQVGGTPLVLQAAWSKGEANNYSQANVWTSDGSKLTGGNMDNVYGDIKQADVLGKWYRTETCVAGDLGKSNGRVDSIEYKMTIPETGQEQLRYLESLPVSGADTRFTGNMIANLFRNEDCSPGRTHVAYGMVAYWSTDEDQWIGPAAEMEDGSINTGGAPPPPASPDAPILLP